MATKQQKAVKSAVTREHNKGKEREEKHVLALLVAIILVLLYLLLGRHLGWWPYSPPSLGSAFYTNVAYDTATPSGSDNSGGSSNSGGSNGGGSGGGPSTPGGSDAILDFAADLDVGDTKTQVDGQANNLGEDCAVLVNAKAQTAGKQEVCTYSQGDKIVTVTYLNDRVISASKSGF